MQQKLTQHCKSTICCSVAKLCLTLCNPMDCSTPVFPVLHCLPDLAQIHVHWVGGAIQPSQFSSVAQSCLILCDAMDYSTPGLPVHHQLLEPTQTHIHWVGDAIQPSHPLSPRSPPAFNLSQHQGLFQCISSSHRGQSIEASASASVLPMNIGDWFPLGLTGLISLQSKTLQSLLQHHSSKASILQRSAFFMAQFSHLYMTSGKTIALTRWAFVNQWIHDIITNCENH